MKDTLGNHTPPLILKAASLYGGSSVFYLEYLKSRKNTPQFKDTLVGVERGYTSLQSLHVWEESEIKGYDTFDKFELLKLLNLQIDELVGDVYDQMLG